MRGGRARAEERAAEIQAQDEVASASENEIASAYAFNAAKVSLARTIGTAVVQP